MLGYFTVLKYEKMVEYDCKNLKKYGLDSPNSAITVDFYQPKDGYTPTATATPNAMVVRFVFVLILFGCFLYHSGEQKNV